MERDKWSREAWNAAEPVYRRILDSPFVCSLAHGTLSPERFKYYIRQDYLYLQSYAGRLQALAARLPRPSQQRDFMRFAADGVAVEEALHKIWLQNDVPGRDEMSPTCLLYTSLLDAQNIHEVEVAAASVLPCFWVYWRVGKHIIDTAGNNLSLNPYRAWIETYADTLFAESTARAIEICDQLAADASEDTRRRMTDIFVLCTKMEWMFWQSAWELERWKI